MSTVHRFELSTMDDGPFDRDRMEEWLADNVRCYCWGSDTTDKTISYLYEHCGKTKGASIHVIEVDDDRGAVAFRLRWHEDVVEHERQVTFIRIALPLAEQALRGYDGLHLQQFLTIFNSADSARDRFNAELAMRFIESAVSQILEVM